jgi:lipoyl-dependent peroxiredoxin
MKRTANAVWTGTAREGQGHISTQSATLNETPYSFQARFGDGKGTNPEELIAAAHAGCFTMATSFALGNAGFTPDRLETKATLTMEQSDGGFTITAVHLDLEANVPGIEQQTFDDIVAGAKANCPVSKVLNAEITLEARLN